MSDHDYDYSMSMRLIKSRDAEIARLRKRVVSLSAMVERLDRQAEQANQQAKRAMALLSKMEER